MSWHPFCCEIVDDTFSTDTSDNYVWFGGTGTIAGGVLTLPSGDFVKFRPDVSTCNAAPRSVRIEVELQQHDSPGTLTSTSFIYFHCDQDLDSGFGIELKTNDGRTESTRRSCLVSLVNVAGGLTAGTIATRYVGPSVRSVVVEVFQPDGSTDAYVTISGTGVSTFSWKFTPTSNTDRYFGIGSIDVDVLFFKATRLLDSTDPSAGCLSCIGSDPVNNCTHTEECNGGTLGEDFYDSGDDAYPPNVGGWNVTAAVWATGNENPSTLWNPSSGLTMVFTRPATGNCGSVIASRIYNDVGTARRYVRVTECENEIVVTIDITKSQHVGMTVSVVLAPLCGGGDITATVSESFSASGSVVCNGTQCLTTDTDTVVNTFQNLPVGIYRVTCTIGNGIGGADPSAGNACGVSPNAFGQTQAEATITLEGVEEYQLTC